MYCGREKNPDLANALIPSAASSSSLPLHFACIALRVGDEGRMDGMYLSRVDTWAWPGGRVDDSRDTVENKCTRCEWVLRGFSPDKLVHLSAVEPGTDRVKGVGLAVKCYG